MVTRFGQPAAEPGSEAASRSTVRPPLTVAGYFRHPYMRCEMKWGTQ
jgi:hypothetical protein